jgi:hypothetical protein
MPTKYSNRTVQTRNKARSSNTSTLVYQYNKEIRNSIKEGKKERETLNKRLAEVKQKEDDLMNKQEALIEEFHKEEKNCSILEPTPNMEKIEKQLISNDTKCVHLEKEKAKISSRIDVIEKRLHSLSSRQLSLGGRRSRRRSTKRRIQ